MACPGEITITRFIEGTLPADRKGAIEEHLNLCSDCQRLVEWASEDTRDGAIGTQQEEPPHDPVQLRSAQAIVEERRLLIVRLHKTIRIALLVWLAFFVVDVYSVAMLSPAPLLYFVVLRLIGAGVLATASYLLSRPRDFSGPQFVAIELGTFSICATLIGLMAVKNGGLESPYSYGVAQVLIVRAVALPTDWRKGAVLLGIPALTYPLVMLPAAFIEDSIHAQLADNSSVATFMLHLSGLAGCFFLAVLSSHFAWSVRRELFESKQLGRYRLRDLIGVGGMGEVWRASDRILSRDVALKILHADRPWDADLARFEREAKATAELTHPHTVRVFDYGSTHDGHRYYAMELLEGQSVRTLIKREGALEPSRAVRMIMQAASALGEAHEKEIAHCDVSPRNLFVAQVAGEPDFIKVLDFGIARVSSSTETPTLTRTGWMGGTPKYMAPEVASGIRGDARSDIYALGAVLFFALTEKAPFERDAVPALLSAHQHDPVEWPLSPLGQKLPATLKQIVIKCLHKTPEQRYQNGKHLAAALRSWLEQNMTLD